MFQPISESTSSLTPQLQVSSEAVDSLQTALIELLDRDWDSPRAALESTDVALDLCAQYVHNTLRQSDRWSADALTAEYLRQMRLDQWNPVEQVVRRRTRGEGKRTRAMTRDLFLAVVDAAARRRNRRPMGQTKATLIVSLVYLRTLLGLRTAAVYPLNVSLSRRDLRRVRFDPSAPPFATLEHDALRRHLEAGGLCQGPTLLIGLRLGLVGLAVARRGAVALARGRGEVRVVEANHREALDSVEQHLLREGQLWQFLDRTDLIRDIAERFLTRRAAVRALLD
jgi:hypothetical protein